MRESISSAAKQQGHTFDEAVQLTGNGKCHYLLLATAGASLLGIAVEGMNMGFVLPVAQCDLDITLTEQGLINAVALIGVVLTAHFWGFMADTWGRRKVLRFSLLTGFILSALSSFSTTSIMLLITRLFVGLTYTMATIENNQNIRRIKIDRFSGYPAFKRPPFRIWANFTVTKIGQNTLRWRQCFRR